MLPIGLALENTNDFHSLHESKFRTRLRNLGRPFPLSLPLANICHPNRFLPNRFGFPSRQVDMQVFGNILPRSSDLRKLIGEKLHASVKGQQGMETEVRLGA
jgi:hypothetical protein